MVVVVLVMVLVVLGVVLEEVEVMASHHCDWCQPNHPRTTKTKTRTLTTIIRTLRIEEKSKQAYCKKANRNK